MLLTILLVSLVAGATSILLLAIKTGNRVLELSSKTVASAAFVTLGCVRWAPGDTVGTWLVAGLLLCAAGDVFLLWTRTFNPGLFSFLLGHLAYVGGFHLALPLSEWSAAIPGPLVVAGAVVLGWLWPRLGRHRVPVLLYIVAISVMLWGAVSTTIRATLPWSAAVGAGLFYLSDLAVARDRFVRSTFLNRAVGLPTYYLGQVLFAVTIGSS